MSRPLREPAALRSGLQLADGRTSDPSPRRKLIRTRRGSWLAAAENEARGNPSRSQPWSAAFSHTPPPNSAGGFDRSTTPSAAATAARATIVRTIDCAGVLRGNASATLRKWLADASLVRSPATVPRALAIALNSFSGAAELRHTVSRRANFGRRRARLPRRARSNGRSRVR